MNVAIMYSQAVHNFSDIFVVDTTLLRADLAKEIEDAVMHPSQELEVTNGINQEMVPARVNIFPCQIDGCITMYDDD